MFLSFSSMNLSCTQKSLFYSLPFLHASGYIALFAFYLGSSFPAFVNSFLLFLFLPILVFYSRSIFCSSLITRFFILLFVIGLLIIASSGLNFSILKGFLVFAVCNFCYGIIVSVGFYIHRYKFFYFYLLLVFIALSFSIIFFLNLPDSISFYGGILGNLDGGNDIYQSFGGYFLRLTLPPWFFVMISSHKIFQSRFNLSISFLPRLLLLIVLLLSVPFLFMLGVKKELLLFCFMILALSLNLLYSNKFLFLCSSVFASFLILFPPLSFVSIVDEDFFIYAVQRFVFSFTARYADFVPTLRLHLAYSLPFGDPNVHILTNTPNYIHSSIISAFVFGGIVSGLLFLFIVFQIIKLLPGFPLSVSFFIVLTIMISFVSTTYDWLFLWFLFGLFAATKVIFVALVFEDGILSMRAKPRRSLG